jgi:hypothetical protein
MSTHDSMTLAERGPVRIASYSCGAIHLPVGPVSLRLEMASFWALSDAVISARQQLTLQWASGRHPIGREARGDA